jgi:hypothetical protein
MNSSTGPKRSTTTMVGRLRELLTYANVVATIAVFLALTGSALGAVIITSNSQVAQGTISGHKPPTGKHANIISGSLNATDLASNAVTNAKIAAFAVTSGKLQGGAVTNGKLATGAVTNSKIGNLAIDDRTIQVGAVTNSDLANGAVSTGKIGVIPQARAEFTSPQGISDNTFTSLCFDTAVFDNDNVWGGDPGPGTCGASGSKTKLIAPVAGVYEVNASVQWDTNSTGARVLRIQKNASTDLVTDQRTAIGFTANSASTMVKLAAGDFVQALVLQNSGGSLNALGISTTSFSMTWVGNG